MIDLSKPLELSDGTPVETSPTGYFESGNYLGRSWVRVSATGPGSLDLVDRYSWPGLSPAEGAAFYTDTGDYVTEGGVSLACLPVLRNRAEPTKDTLEDTLKTRGETYGSFTDNSGIAQALKAILRAAPKWNSASTRHKEAADHIASKLSRLFSGDTTHTDSWVDIAGYAQLAAGKEPSQ